MGREEAIKRSGERIKHLEKAIRNYYPISETSIDDMDETKTVMNMSKFNMCIR